MSSRSNGSAEDMVLAPHRSLPLVVHRLPRWGSAFFFAGAALSWAGTVLWTSWSLGVAWGFGAPSVPDADRGWYGLLALVGAVVAWLLVRRGFWVAKRPHPRIELGDSELVVVAPSVLREPLRIPTGLLESGLVDDEKRWHRLWHDVRRFPRRVPDGSFEWLYSVSGGARYPVVGAGHERPNVALLFSTPVGPPAVRRRPWLWWSPMRRSTLRRGQHLGGLLLRTEDVDDARVALSSLGLLRDLDRPPPGVAPQRTWRSSVAQLVRVTPMLVLLVAGVVYDLGWLSGPADSCDEVERLLEGRSDAPQPVLDAAGGVDVETLFALLPPAPGPHTDRIIDLETAAARRVNPEESLVLLRRYGYALGVERQHHTEDHVETTTVYLFVTEENAAAFDTYANRFACRFSTQAFTVDAHPSAIGQRLRTSGGGVVDQVSFTRGPHRFVAAIWWEHPPDGHAATETLLEQLIDAAGPR